MCNIFILFSTLQEISCFLLCPNCGSNQLRKGRVVLLKKALCVFVESVATNDKLLLTSYNTSLLVPCSILDWGGK